MLNTSNIPRRESGSTKRRACEKTCIRTCLVTQIIIFIVVIGLNVFQILFETGAITSTAKRPTNVNLNSVGPRVPDELEEKALRAQLSRKCGVPSSNLSLDVQTSSLFGYKWPKNDLFYKISKYPSDNFVIWNMGGLQGFHMVIQKAFKVWENVTNLTFTRKPKGDDVDIEISFERGEHGDGSQFGSRSHQLAHAITYVKNDTEICFCQIHFDDSEEWETRSLFRVAVHETGHSIGLDHSNSSNSIMWSAPYKNNLEPDDLFAIEALYGKRATTSHINSGSCIWGGTKNWIFVIVVAVIM